MNVTVQDAIKSVVVGLSIAVLNYVAITTVDVLTKEVEVSSQRTAIAEKPGYLIQFDNDTRAAIEGVTITIIRKLSIDTASADNGVTITTTPAANSTVITLGQLPPNRRTNVFIATADALQNSDFSIILKGASHRLLDKNSSERRFFDMSHFLNALMVFAVAPLFYLWATSLHNRLSGLVNDVQETAVRRQRELEDTRQEVKRMQGIQLRLRLLMQRRVLDLSAENDLWRNFFKTVYSKLFTTSSDAERVIELLLKRVGLNLRRDRQLRDISEQDFIEMLFEEKFEERAGKLP